MSKVKQLKDALSVIKSQSKLLVGGFGLSGVPDTILNQMTSMKVNGLSVVSNNAGLDGKGLSQLLTSGQVNHITASYIGGNKTFERLYLQGAIDVELIPQGNIAERLRAGAAGVPAFYSPAGVGTWLEEGKLPVRYNSEGQAEKLSEAKEVRQFDGRKFLLERAIVGDVALVKAYKADTLGNCWFRGSARNFNSVMGRCGRHTIVEAENIVEPGEIEPENVHLPGIYVDSVVQSTTPKEIEIVKLRSGLNQNQIDAKRLMMVKRAAQELPRNGYANLGIGIPTLAANYVDYPVVLQSENGILGMGPYPEAEADADLINAGKETVTLNKGASLFGSEEAFAMIRAGRINLTMLGALQVSQYGDLANWSLPGKVKGIGGAMDLVADPSKTRVVVVMDHVDKRGRPKILNECSFPLTGPRCVSRIITDLAVFDVDFDSGLTLVELMSGATLEQVKNNTEASFSVAL